MPKINDDTPPQSKPTRGRPRKKTLPENSQNAANTAPKKRAYVRKSKTEPSKTDSKNNFPDIKRDENGFITTIAAASLLGVSDKTIRNWRDLEDCDAVSVGGAVDLPKLHNWILEREKRPLLEKVNLVNELKSKGNLTIEELNIRNLRSQNILQNIKVEKELGNLLPKDLYMHKLSTILSEIMTRLNPIGVNLGPRLSVESDPVVCTRLIDDAKDKILKELTVAIIINGRKEDDPFLLADQESAEAERQAQKEIEEEKNA